MFRSATSNGGRPTVTHDFDWIPQRQTIPQQALEEPERSLVLEYLHVLTSCPDESSVGHGPSGRVRRLLRDDDGHAGLVV